MKPIQWKTGRCAQLYTGIDVWILLYYVHVYFSGLTSSVYVYIYFSLNIYVCVYVYMCSRRFIFTTPPITCTPGDSSNCLCHFFKLIATILIYALFIFYHFDSLWFKVKCNAYVYIYLYICVTDKYNLVLYIFSFIRDKDGNGLTFEYFQFKYWNSETIRSWILSIFFLFGCEIFNYIFIWMYAVISLYSAFFNFV